MKVNKVVAIVGNIGVGKTTAIQSLIENYQWDVLAESVSDNPYLEDFYDNPDLYTFGLQVYFISNKLYRYVDLLETSKSPVLLLDRSVGDDVGVFAKTLNEMGKFNDRDYKTYVKVGSLIDKIIQEKKPIDHYIYLRTGSIDRLMNRVLERGRPYEVKNVTREYLLHLNNNYDIWVDSLFAQGKRVSVMDTDIYGCNELVKTIYALVRS